MQDTPFPTLLAALEDSGQPFPSKYTAKFSDLSAANVHAFMQVWARLPLARKTAVLKKLRDAYQADTLLSFEPLALPLLEDPASEVRLYALQFLDETENPHFLPSLTQILASDPEPACRIQAAVTLSIFVRLVELEKLPAKKLALAFDRLLAAASDSNAQVARAALETLGYSSRPEAAALIGAAFQRRDPHWQASALLAAGHSMDLRWQDEVLNALVNEDSFIRLAAVRAAGEMELKPARQILLDLLEEDEEDDDEILEAAIWSLSLIGGEDVRTYLQILLDNAEDEDFSDFLEEALMNLSFTEEIDDFSLMAFDEEEPREKRKK